MQNAAIFSSIKISMSNIMWIDTDLSGCCFWAVTDSTCASCQLSPSRQASTVSPTKYLSLTKLKISSDISAKEHRFVLVARYSIGIRSSIGKSFNCFLAAFSLCRASEYVRLFFPVISHVHTMELTSMILSQYSLKTMNKHCKKCDAKHGNSEKRVTLALLRGPPRTYNTNLLLQ